MCCLLQEVFFVSNECNGATLYDALVLLLTDTRIALALAASQQKGPQLRAYSRAANCLSGCQLDGLLQWPLIRLQKRH